MLRLPGCKISGSLAKRVLLGGSWDLVSRVIIRVTILITPIKGLRTVLTESHDPPSKLLDVGVSENRGPQCSTLNSRIVIIRTPK